MLNRTFSRLIIAAALLCATLAWTGWAYLNTAAAPHRFEDVAVAVLDDPEARFELAGPLADQIVASTGVDPAHTPRIRDAVAEAMADPRVAANVTGAFGSVHARAVGVDDQRPATVDGAALVTAVRERLATVDPELATLLPEFTVGDLELPEYHPPLVSSLRRVAVACTTWLALIAAVLLAVALLVGNRRYVLRRFGVWAILTGAVWAIGPRVLVEVVHRMVPEADATLAAAIGAATRTVMGVATVVVAIGIVAVIGAQFAGRAVTPAAVPAALPVRPRGASRPAPKPVPFQTMPVAVPPATPTETRATPTRSVTPAGRAVAPTLVIRPAPSGVDHRYFAPGSPLPPHEPDVIVDQAQRADPVNEVDPWAYFTTPADKSPADTTPADTTPADRAGGHSGG